ncbi:MAG: ATP-dependent Clp protease ATP-binding subunit [Oligoflexia bacterium]|nr:ATP-dependent Clp protease ATP-binding subunit [Oligoflexia bacterium]
MQTKRDKNAAVVLEALGSESASVTGKYQQDAKEKTFRPIPDRENEANRGIQILARMKGSSPVFLGEAGVGKTTIVQRIAQKIVSNDLPKDPTYDFLRNAEMIEVTPGGLSKLAKSNDNTSQAAAVESFFESILNLQKKLKKQIIVYIDECHNLSSAQWESMKRYLEMQGGPKLVFSSTAKEYQMMVGNNDALRRRLVDVNVLEFNAEKTKKVLEEYWIPQIEKRYNVRFNTIADIAVDAAIKTAPELYPDIRRPDSALKVLQAIATHLTQKIGTEGRSAAMSISAKDIYQYVAEETGVPFSPYDSTGFFKYLKNKKAELNKEVINQEQLVDGLMDSYRSIMLSVGGKKMHTTTMIMGPTGVGKTYVAEKLAEKLYGNTSRMLVVDCTQFSGGGDDYSLNDLLGAPAGVVSSDRQKGRLIEFLDGPGKQGGVIVFNEAEKAGPAFWKKLMEFFDKGEIVGNDSRTRKLNKHMIILTSNKGSKRIFPRNKILTSEDIKAVTANYKGAKGQKLLKNIFLTDDDKRHAQASQALPPEIVNRIDNFALAAPRLIEDAEIIARQEVDKSISNIKTKYGIDFNISDEVVKNMALSSFSPEDGARQISQQIRTYLNRAIEEAMTTAKAVKGDTIVLQLKKAGTPLEKSKIVITNKNKDIKT